MKYLYQLGIILGISFAAELLHLFIELPVPASVYGIVILFLLLQSKILKLHQVEDTANYFMIILPILFLPPSIGLMESVGGVAGNLIWLVLMIIISTFVVTVVTGKVAQSIILHKKKKTEKLRGDQNE